MLLRKLLKGLNKKYTYKAWLKHKFYDVCSVIKLSFFIIFDVRTTSGSRGGAHPARAPLTAADLWFFYAQNAKFSQFFLRSRLILGLILLEIWQKNAKNDFLLQPSTLSIISYPPPVDKVHAPLRSNPGSATENYSYILQISLLI